MSWTRVTRPPVPHFMQIGSQGASQLGKWVKHNKFILYFYIRLVYRSDPWTDFHAQWLKRRGLAQGCEFWGLEN